jgi:diketogulonate reductase-like aldo/keto reductase
MTDMNRRDALRLLGTSVAGLVTAPESRWLRSAPSQSPILTRLIPSSGETIPVIGMGTWQTFDVGSKPADRAPLEDVLRVFVELGGKVVDSSPMYGTSEEVLGDIASKLGVRSRLFLATKVWTSGKQRGIEQMEDSMRKLRARTIDLMQVHNLVDASTHLDTLAAWKQEGRIRYFGVTHYTAGAHDDVARIVESHQLDFVQINYSAAEREADRRLLPLARERGVAVIANRPFAGGDLFRQLRRRRLPGWAGEIKCDTWAQVLLKYVISHPSITCAIPATSKVTHLRDNLRAGTGPLPDERLRSRIVAEVG